MVSIEHDTVEIGEVRPVDTSAKRCEDMRTLFAPEIGPIGLLFRKAPFTSDSDVLEVQLKRTLPDDTNRGSFNISGDFYTQFGGDSFCQGTFAGHYHPDHQRGILKLSPQALS